VLLKFVDLVPLQALKAALGMASITARVTGINAALEDFSECLVASALWLCFLVCLLLVRK